MVFSYEKKVIIRYLRTKCKYGVTRIVNDHPEYEWNINGVKKLLKKIGEIDHVAGKESSGRPKSVCTEESIKLIEEIILSQKVQPETHSTPTQIARELNINFQSVPRIVDQNLDLRSLRKRKI